MWYGTIVSRDAAQTAGGRPHHPKGGGDHADHFTYRFLYGNDYDKETRKPPPGTVTVF